MRELVGRSNEVERLVTAALDDTHAEVVGEAGIGKSRLLAEVGGRLSERRIDVEWIYASAPELSVPFAPFAHLLADDLPSLESTELLGRVVAALEARCARSRLCVLVDDAHQLDAVSIELLHQVMQRLDPAVIAASRPEPGLDPRLRAAVRDRGGPRIDLGPLERTATARLLECVIDGPVNVHVHDEIHRLSGGSPFVTIELAAAGTVSGALRRDDEGRWSLGERITTPPRVHDLIAERIRPLDAESVEVLRMLAVSDGMSIASLLTEVPMECLAGLEASGLVVLVTRNELRHVALAHDLHRDVLLDSPEMLLAAARERALRALDRSPTDDGLELLAARLSLEIGRPDPERHLRASHHARRAWDNDLALRLATAAVKEGAGPRAIVARAQALGALGRSVEAHDLFDVVDRSDDLDLVAESTCARAMVMMSQEGDPMGAVALLRRGIERCGPDHDAPMRAALAGALFFTGQIEAAVATAQPLVDRSERFPSNAAPALLGGWAVMGRPAEVVRTAELVWSQLDGDDDDEHYVGVNLIFCRLLALAQLGRLSEGDGPGGHIPRPGTWPGRRSWVVQEAMVATHQYLRGHLDASAESYERIGTLIDSSPSQVRVMNEAIVAALMAQRGDHVAGRRHLTSIESFPPGALTLFQWWIDRAELWCTAAEGALSTAVDACRALALRHRGQHYYTTCSLHDVVRLGRASLVLEDLDAAAGRPGATWLDRVCADHARAAAHHDAPSLLEISSRFEAGGLDLLALESAAQALAAGERAVTTQTRARHRFERLMEVCGTVGTPAVVVERSPLTERELEVATLAAGGSSNAEIGRRLGTSPRTVGNQLQQVYQKLGIHGRDEL